MLDFEHCYRAIAAKDARFDGSFTTAVTSTGIYCRPSCPARTPKRQNVRFFSTAAAAQAAGFRACKRCRPDAAPGSPEWDARADLVGRAMRLIADGVVDREGVGGLAARLGYSERHLTRCLTDAVGAGPLALARAGRAQTARVLLETTDLGIAELALTAGFASVRQFNSTIRQVFDSSPRQLRARRRRPDREQRLAGAEAGTDAAGGLRLRLAVRAPFDWAGTIGFLAARAVPGLEQSLPGGYRRALALPRGNGVVELASGEGHVGATFWLDDLRDLGAAISRCRRLLDLDSDPQAILERLGADTAIGALVRSCPGRRVPGSADGAELAIRAVLGQQVSVAGARTMTARLLARHGERLSTPVGDVTHAFPSCAVLAALDPAELAMPRSRASALIGLAGALHHGELVLDEGADRDTSVASLLALPGIGPWTAGYVAMRALRDPDAYPSGDLGVRRALEALGVADERRELERDGAPWRPYRAYATLHLWAVLEGVASERGRPRDAAEIALAA